MAKKPRHSGERLDFSVAATRGRTLERELLCSTEMSPIRGYADPVKLADFFGESFSFFAPGDENRVCFRDDVWFVPLVSSGASLPDGMFKIGTD